MSVGTIGRVMQSSRATMLRMQSTDAATTFRDEFGLGDGDYIEIRRFARREGHTSHVTFIKARIVQVCACYLNRGGGYTAFLSVVPINLDGRLGCSRRVMMVKDKRGKVGNSDHHEARTIQGGAA